MSNASELSDEQWVKARQEGVTVTYEPEYARFRISTHIGNGVHRAIGYGDTRDLAYADARRRLEPKPDAEAIEESDSDFAHRRNRSGSPYESVMRAIDSIPLDRSAQPKPDAAGESDFRKGFEACKELAMRIVDEHDGFLNRIEYLDADIAEASALRKPELAAAAKDMAEALERVNEKARLYADWHKRNPKQHWDLMHSNLMEVLNKSATALARYRTLEARNG